MAPLQYPVQSDEETRAQTESYRHHITFHSFTARPCITITTKGASFYSCIPPDWLVAPRPTMRVVLLVLVFGSQNQFLISRKTIHDTCLTGSVSESQTTRWISRRASILALSLPPWSMLQVLISVAARTTTILCHWTCWRRYAVGKHLCITVQIFSITTHHDSFV